MNRRRRGLILLAALPLAACGGDTPPAAAPAAVPALETTTLATELAPRERVWDGVVEAVDQATLSAQTAGRVVELPFDVDDYVPAGAVVVRFTDVEQQAAQRQARAQFAAAEAAAREAEADFTRVEGIYARKLVARAQLDAATARRDSARAALEAARAAVRSSSEQVDYTVIRAPYSGIVVRRHVQVGESVRPGQPLISGISLGRLRVQVEVPQSDVGPIRASQRAALVLDDGARRIDAREVVVFPYADPATHTFKVRVELPEAETGLSPGMTVKVAFAVGEAPRLLLPATAVVRRGEIAGAYVVDEAGVGLRQLRLGHRFGDRYEVLAGLSAGDRVALDPLAAGRALASAR
jgi:RND family efflux transporter MFP subunit